MSEENTHNRHTWTTNVFLKNYIYIILLFYREPYQKYKILTKNLLQYIKITSIFSRSLGKAYIQKIFFIDIYNSLTQMTPRVRAAG